MPNKSYWDPPHQSQWIAKLDSPSQFPLTEKTRGPETAQIRSCTASCVRTRSKTLLLLRGRPKEGESPFKGRFIPNLNLAQSSLESLNPPSGQLRLGWLVRNFERVPTPSEMQSSAGILKTTAEMNDRRGQRRFHAAARDRPTGRPAGLASAPLPSAPSRTCGRPGEAPAGQPRASLPRAPPSPRRARTERAPRRPRGRVPTPGRARGPHGARPQSSLPASLRSPQPHPAVITTL